MKILRYFLLPLTLAALATSNLDAMKRTASEFDQFDEQGSNKQFKHESKIRFAWDQAGADEYLEVPERSLKHSIVLDTLAKSYENYFRSNPEYIIPTDAEDRDLLQAIFDCLNIIDESEDQAVTSLLRYIEGTNYPPHGFAVLGEELQIAKLEEACKDFTKDLDCVNQETLNLQQTLEQALAVFAQIEDKSKHAVIFDIDGTALSGTKNLGPIVINDIASKMPYFVAIDHVLKFYKNCLEMGFKIFFVTARADKSSLDLDVCDMYHATVRNLEQEGYNIFEEIICIPLEERFEMKNKAGQDSTMEVQLCADWKEFKRNEIAKKYTIAGTLDDIKENLEGDNVGHAILIPHSF